MIYFPPLQMRRFTARIRELSLAQSLAIAAIPLHLDEMATTEFLRACVEDAQLDPALWTVQERIMGVAHYLSSTSDGSPDFAVGSGWTFSDYFIPEATARKEASEQFDHAGDTWRAVPVLGRYAQSIERLNGELEGIQGKAHWIIGLMAAGLERDHDDKPGDDTADDAVDAWMMARMRVLLDYPESDFIALMQGHAQASTEIAHLFRIRSDDAGIIVMPTTEGAGIPPARFPVFSAISDFAQAVAGKHA